MQKVIIADGHFISQEGLSKIVNDQKDLTLNAVVTSHDELSNHLDKVIPQLLIINLENQVDQYLKLINQYRLENSSLVLVDTKFKKEIKNLWQSRIKSIVTNKCSKEEITRALGLLKDGEEFYCNKIKDVIEESDETLASQHGLTQRELEVVQLITKGKSTQEISDTLFVSKHTINSHRKSILKKLDLKSPVELIVYAIEHNLK